MLNSKKKIIGLVLIVVSFLFSFIIFPYLNSFISGIDKSKQTTNETNFQTSIGGEKDGSSAQKLFSLYTLDGKYGAISISFPKNSDVLDNYLKTGDVVSIVSNDNLSGEKGFNILPELKYLYILKVSKTESSNLTLTFLANERQANLISSLEDSKKIKVFLVFRGDEKTTLKFINTQDKFFKNKKE